MSLKCYCCNIRDMKISFAISCCYLEINVDQVHLIMFSVFALNYSWKSIELTLAALNCLK